MSRTSEYPLGYSPEEARRLEAQAALMAQFTRDFLLRAGIAPGMRVLDLGCGVGDVSMLAAGIVGPEGEVLGIDRSEASVAAASERAATQGLGQVSFLAAELTDFAPQGLFDAIIGRFVLSYVPDRVPVLRRLAQSLRPGGIVAMQEIDMTYIGQEPASPLFTEARRCVLAAFAATGAELEMGALLAETLADAGLSAPETLAIVPVEGGPDCGGYEQIAQTLSSLMPIVERENIASAAALDVATLGQRLADDARAKQRHLTMSRIVGAFART